MKNRKNKIEKGKQKWGLRAFISRNFAYRRFLKHLPPVTLVLIFFLVFFTFGFVSFSEKIYSLQLPAPSQQADGIIVLTGGRDRLETGVRLLENGRGKRLLISGVNPAAGRAVLLRVTGADPHLFDCCVDLGWEAANTIGNAEESVHWVEKNGYHAVFIVTSSYHMPRSLTELKRRMPDIQLIPYPVGRVAGDSQNMLQCLEQLRILIVEYIKFLGVCARNIMM